jgi:hypothetical protein
MTNQQDDFFDDGYVKKGRHKSPVNELPENCPTEETAAFIMKSTMVPIMTFRDHQITPPVKACTECRICLVEPLCRKRVASRLPVMCERVFAADFYLLKRHETEELKSLMLLED